MWYPPVHARPIGIRRAIIDSLSLSLLLRSVIDKQSHRLGFGEFSALSEMADVVLDPFPVGGGRSSLEIFAVGTPIVMLYNRTSVLQVYFETSSKSITLGTSLVVV